MQEKGCPLFVQLMLPIQPHAVWSVCNLWRYHACRRREADEAAAALDRAKSAEVERRRQARLQLLAQEKERQHRIAELQAAKEAHERALQERRVAAAIRVQVR